MRSLVQVQDGPFVFGGLAQLVERLLCKQDVSGSSPLTSINGRRCDREVYGWNPASFHFDALRVSIEKTLDSSALRWNFSAVMIEMFSTEP